MRRRWLTRFAALAAVGVALGLLALGGFTARRAATWRADERRVEEALARLDADDPGWRPAGVLKAHNDAIPADAANASRAAFAALALRPPSWKARDVAIHVDRTIPDITSFDDRLPDDEAVCSLYEVSLESGDAFRAALAARRFATGGLRLHLREPDPYSTLLPDLQSVGEFANLLSDYAAIEAYLGHGDKALRAAAASLHVTQVTLSTEPLTISQLIRLSCLGVAVNSAQRTIAWSEPAEGLADLQAAFARAAEVDGVTPALRGERAFAMVTYSNVRNGTLPGNYFDTLLGGRSVPWTQRLKNRSEGGTVARRQLEALRVLDEFLAAAKLRGPARRSAANAIDIGTGEHARTLLPNLTRHFDRDDAARGQLLCASVGLACERYRRQTGHFPKALADIPTAILPAIPTDPGTGQPIAYQLLEDGALVSSAWPDAVEDAEPGVALRLLVPGLGRANFRLWDPASRRRPPLPPLDLDADFDGLPAPGEVP